MVTYDPRYDKAPNLRDIFAMQEHTMPTVLQDPTRAAEFIGVPVNAFKPLIHSPMVLAKWRYQCADAMLNAGGHNGSKKD